MIDYKKILKQALEITRTNKFLRLFGLFLSLGFLYTSTKPALNYWTSLILAVGYLVFVRVIVSLIVGIKAVVDKKKTSLKLTLRASRLFFGRVFIILIVVGLVLAAASLILGTPILFIFEKGLTFRADLLLALGLVVFLPVFFISVLVIITAPLYVVIYDLKVREATQRAFDLASRYSSQLISLLILLVVIDLPALFLWQFMVELRGGIWVNGIITIVFLWFESAFIVFCEAVWIIAFLDLNKPVKMEEEILPVPEFI